MLQTLATVPMLDDLTYHLKATTTHVIPPAECWINPCSLLHANCCDSCCINHRLLRCCCAGKALAHAPEDNVAHPLPGLCAAAAVCSHKRT
jgi:hypothetical protein